MLIGGLGTLYPLPILRYSITKAGFTANDFLIEGFQYD